MILVYILTGWDYDIANDYNRTYNITQVAVGTRIFFLNISTLMQTN